jgi:hypothetical protein
MPAGHDRRQLRKNYDQTRHESPGGFPRLLNRCHPRNDGCPDEHHQEEMKAQVGSLASRTDMNQESLDTKKDTIQEKMDAKMSVHHEKMEVIICTIRSKLEGTIKQWVQHFLACVDQDLHSVFPLSQARDKQHKVALA